MIILRLTGGLGNQLFQLSAAIFLANKHNINNIIIDDSSLSKYKTARICTLARLIDFNQIGIGITFKKSKLASFRVPKFLPVLPFVSDVNFYKAKNKCYRNYILDGYFQDCWDQVAFNNIVNLIRRSLIMNNIYSSNERICVVHIRGGDFIDLGWDKALPIDYYPNAMNFMEVKYHISKFVVVTDDIVYAKNVVRNGEYECEFQSGDDVSDFNTILGHKNRILSSSTFAFWASALGVMEGAVVAPKYWNIKRKRNIVLSNEVDFQFEMPRSNVKFQ